MFNYLDEARSDVRLDLERKVEKLLGLIAKGSQVF